MGFWFFLALAIAAAAPWLVLAASPTRRERDQRSETTWDAHYQKLLVRGQQKLLESGIESPRHLLSSKYAFLPVASGIAVPLIGGVPPAFFFPSFLLGVGVSLLSILALWASAPANVAACERDEDDFEDRLHQAKRIIRSAYELQQNYSSTTDERRAQVQVSASDFLDRAVEIQSFRDPTSPLFDEGSRYRLAAFAKRHFSQDMREVSASKPSAIAAILESYRAHELEMLAHASSRDDAQDVHAAVREFRELVSLLAAKVAEGPLAIQQIQQKAKEAKETVRNNEALTPEERASQEADIDAFAQKSVDRIRRTGGIF